MRLLLLAAALAWARPATKKVPSPPAVAEARDPGPGAPSTEPPAPPITGHTSGFELEALRRRSTTFRFEVDTSALAIGADAAARLERHLAADPRWRIVERDGARLAIQRQAAAGGWHIGPTGYVIGAEACHRVALRLDPRDPSSAWAQSPQVGRLQAGRSDVGLVVFATGSAPCEAQAATALVVEGPALALEVFESDDGGDRPVTLEALAGAIDLVNHLGVASDAIDARGYDPYALPSGEPVTADEPSVALTSPGPGLLELAARVNPGARGWTWLRVLDGALQPWAVEPVGRGTRERSGWSDDPTALFHVGGIFAVPSGPAFSGTAELWFQGEGGAPVLLTATPIDVPAR